MKRSTRGDFKKETITSIFEYFNVFEEETIEINESGWWTNVKHGHLKTTQGNLSLSVWTNKERPLSHEDDNGIIYQYPSYWDVVVLSIKDTEGHKAAVDYKGNKKIDKEVKKMLPQKIAELFE